MVSTLFTIVFEDMEEEGVEPFQHRDEDFSIYN
jgi:hypothetical protein